MALDVRTGPCTQVAPAKALRAQRARYLPIAEHGLIGDLHTVALVGTDGTIDWYCCPRFDSPSVFAAIRDADRGGVFRIGPDRRRLDLQTALSPRHQRPDHPLPDGGRSG
jgi:GH15 family glucan-1,4-alpha-glucosidase